MVEPEHTKCHGPSTTARDNPLARFFFDSAPWNQARILPRRINCIVILSTRSLHCSIPHRITKHSLSLHLCKCACPQFLCLASQAYLRGGSPTTQRSKHRNTHCIPWFDVQDCDREGIKRPHTICAHRIHSEVSAVEWWNKTVGEKLDGKNVVDVGSGKFARPRCDSSKFYACRNEKRASRPSREQWVGSQDSGGQRQKRQSTPSFRRRALFLSKLERKTGKVAGKHVARVEEEKNMSPLSKKRHSDLPKGNEEAQETS